jgi:TetR/AcrR family transcriptional repressor of nem operon
LAPKRPANDTNQCLVVALERTCRGHHPTAVDDPKREFDRELALEYATRVFWAKGFAATSTDDLIEAMGIGRQGLYNAFGDKRALYLEALRSYQRATTAGHLRRLNEPTSPVAGIRSLLLGLIADDDELRPWAAWA